MPFFDIIKRDSYQIHLVRLFFYFIYVRKEEKQESEREKKKRYNTWYGNYATEFVWCIFSSVYYRAASIQAWGLIAQIWLGPK